MKAKPVRTEVTLRGLLVGPIWMPTGANCFKELNQTFERSRESVHPISQVQTMEELLERVTNDGDFQHCRVQDATMTVTHVYANGRRVSRMVCPDGSRDGNADYYQPYEEWVDAYAE